MPDQSPLSLFGRLAVPEGTELPEEVKPFAARYPRVLDPMRPMFFDRERRECLAVPTFRLAVAGHFAPPENAGGRPVPVAHYALNDTRWPAVDAVGVWPPPLTAPARMLNTWEGFAVKAEPGDIGPWVAVLRQVVPDPKAQAYLVRWLAWKVQHPGLNPNVALVLHGPEGTGKTSLFAPVVQAFGPGHGELVDNCDQLVGRFTSFLRCVLFLVADEALFTGDPRVADKLKGMITSTRRLVEGKGTNQTFVENLTAWVILSNHERVVPTGPDARRYCVMRSGVGAIKDKALWQRFYRWLERENGAGKLLHHLQAVQLGAFDIRAFPKTDAFREQVHLHLMADPAFAWWSTVLSEGVIVHPHGRVTLSETEHTEVDRTSLREAFSASVRRGYPPSWETVAKKLHTWAQVRSVQKRAGTLRQRFDVFPPLPELKALFTAATGVSIDDGSSPEPGPDDPA